MQSEYVRLVLSRELWISNQVGDGGMVDDGGYSPAVENCNIKANQSLVLFCHSAGLESRLDEALRHSVVPEATVQS